MKINEKFLPLFELPENVRYFILTGGRFSQKSFAASTAATIWSHNFNYNILYSRYTLASASDSIIPEFQEKLEMFGIEKFYQQNKDRIFSKDSKIVFKGIKTSSGKQTAKLKSLKDFNVFILDEAEEENDEESFDKINLSIRSHTKKNVIVLILNPSTKTHWIYKRFFEDVGVQEGFNGIKNNVCYIHTSYLDAIDYISPDYLKELENLERINPEKFKHLILGGWLDKMDNVIFPNWKYGKFDETLPFGYGLDFGSTDPDALVKCAIDTKQMKLYLKNAFSGSKNTTKTLIEGVNNTVQKGRLIVADSAQPRSILDIQGAKHNIIGVKKYAGSVEDGVRLMGDFEIIVDPESREIGIELNNYHKKNGMIIDAYNHFLDAARYYVQTVYNPYKKQTGVKIL